MVLALLVQAAVSAYTTGAMTRPKLQFEPAKAEPSAAEAMTLLSRLSRAELEALVVRKLADGCVQRADLEGSSVDVARVGDVDCDCGSVIGLHDG